VVGYRGWQHVFLAIQRCEVQFPSTSIRPSAARTNDDYIKSGQGKRHRLSGTVDPAAATQHKPLCGRDAGVSRISNQAGDFFAAMPSVRPGSGSTGLPPKPA